MTLHHLLTTYKEVEERLSVLQRDVGDLNARVASGEVTTGTEEATPKSNVVRVGFLEKKGAIRRNWLKRHFVLGSDHYLRYYSGINVRRS
jgi:hypothetical protein